MQKLQWFGFFAVGLLGCGGASDSGESEAESESETGGNLEVTPVEDNNIEALNCAANCTTLVANSAVVPTQSMPFECDVDENGSSENGLGNLLTLVQAMGSGASFQDSLDESIVNGDFVLLMAIQSDNLSNDPTAGLQTWLGADSDDDWSNNTQDTDGDGTADALLAGSEFAIAEDSPTDLAMGGEISGGAINFGPGRLLIQLALPEAAGGDSADIEMYAVKLAGPVTTESGVGYDTDPATLCGGIPGPLFEQLIADISNGLCAEDPEGDGCSFVMDTLDTDDNGSLTAGEVAKHPLRQSLLGNDLDLFIGEYKGAETPRGTDGQTDSLSFGLGFTAVPAVFAIPGSGTE